MPNEVEVKVKKKRKKKRPKNLPEILDNKRLSSLVVKKLKSGGNISTKEFLSLFKSDDVEEHVLDEVISTIANTDSKYLLDNLSSLYVEDPEIIHGYLDFWCPNLENEMLSYFRSNPDQLYTMNPRSFEELVAAIFKNNGFSVELTPQTRDGGVDIIAVQHSVLTGKSINLIECKRYSPDRKVGIGMVQRLLGTVNQMRASKGILVTTSFFSKDALHVEQTSQHQLLLSDYSKITSWLDNLNTSNKSL